MTQTGDPDKTLKTREVKDSQGNGYLIDDPDVLRLMGEMEGQLQPFFRGEATLLVTDKPLEMEDSHDGGEDEVPFNEDYSEPEAEEPQPSFRMLANKVYADRMAAGHPKGEQD